MKITTLFLSIAVTGSSRENKQTAGVGLYVNQAYICQSSIYVNQAYQFNLAIKVDEVIELHFIELRAIPNYDHEYMKHILELRMKD